MRGVDTPMHTVLVVFPFDWLFIWLWALLSSQFCYFGKSWKDLSFILLKYLIFQETFHVWRNFSKYLSFLSLFGLFKELLLSFISSGWLYNKYQMSLTTYCSGRNRGSYFVFLLKFPINTISHSLQMGTKSHLKKQLQSQFPPEMS